MTYVAWKFALVENYHIIDIYIYPINFTNYFTTLAGKILLEVYISTRCIMHHNSENSIKMTVMNLLWGENSFYIIPCWGIGQLQTGITIGNEFYKTGSSQRRALFLRALSLYGITKWSRKYHSPILNVFKNQISQYKIYLLNYVFGHFLFIYYPEFCCKRHAGFVFKFFLFTKIPSFYF